MPNYNYLHKYIQSKEDDQVTDKELKKLSRLELLELLLTESRENERLREELEKIKKENAIEKSAQQLNEVSKQMDETSEKLGDALKQISELVNGLGKRNDIVKESESDLFSDDSDETQQRIVSKEIQTEKTEENELSDYEKDRPDDISKQISEAMQLISLRIEELDRIAEIVKADNMVSDYEN